MIQFNLLPDVKLEYIKARRTKRLVVLVSTLVAGVSIAIMVVLFIGTNVLQRQHLDHLQGDIERDSQRLEDVEDLDKILTVQNQLGVLDELHAQKPAAARLGNFLPQLTPQEVTITDMEVNFADNTMVFDGTAPNLAGVNRFVDTLKFTKYKVGDQDEASDAFSSVVLSSFSRSDEQSGETNDRASFQITLNFDSTIFDIEKSVKLQVPKTTTTRSAIESPASPFQDPNNGQVPNGAGGEQ